MKENKHTRTRRLASRLAMMVVVMTAACGQPDATDPVASDQRGREVVRAMSDLLAGAQAITFATDQVRVRARGAGLDTLTVSQEVAMRRPDGFTWHTTGTERDLQGWYDGDSLTVVANGIKGWAAVDMPPTIDEGLDELAVEYDIPIPMGDMMYSNPYEALFSGEGTGGWKGAEEINGQTCDHVGYVTELVDWELWVAQGDRPLPCRLSITYKQEPGPPRRIITFRDWNLSAQIPEDRFQAKVPEGYGRIAVIGREPEETEAVEAEVSEAAPEDTAQP